MAEPSPLSASLIDHLTRYAVRTDGPFTLRSGQVSDFYIDARQTTFDGRGAALVGAAVVDVLADGVQAVGGMTMGADPIAVASAVVAAGAGRTLRAFSIRKSAKDHGTGGRLVGPVTAGNRVAIVDDTVTTGGALLEAIDVAEDGDLVVAQVVCLVDRSGGALAERLSERDLPYVALATPKDLGVS